MNLTTVLGRACSEVPSSLPLDLQLFRRHAHPVSSPLVTGFFVWSAQSPTRYEHVLSIKMLVAKDVCRLRSIWLGGSRCRSTTVKSMYWACHENPILLDLLEGLLGVMFLCDVSTVIWISWLVRIFLCIPPGTSSLDQDTASEKTSDVT